MSKIKSAAQLKEIVDRERSQGRSLVFTNGCFDLLHLGHLHLLKQAKKEGDFLVVAINSDRSVRRIKGARRPIHHQRARAVLVASLEMVDYVTVFDEVDPLGVIRMIKPNVLVKGGDWKTEDVIGKEFAKRVVIVPYKPGHSTTNIIKKDRKSVV